MSLVDFRGVQIRLEKGHYRHPLADRLRAAIDVVESLGLTLEELEAVIPDGLALYREARRRLRSTTAIEEAALQCGVPLRDFVAMRLIEELEYTQAEAARAIGLDDSHLGRRLRRAKTRLATIEVAPPS